MCWILIEKASNINGYYLLSTFYVPGTIFIAVMLNFQYLVLTDKEIRGYIAQGPTNLVSVSVRIITHSRLLQSLGFTAQHL